MVVPVVVVPPAEGSSWSPCALWAGHAFRLIRILTNLPLPVRWQTQSFLAECLSVVVPVPVDVEAVGCFFPLPSGGPFAIATDVAMPAANTRVMTSALSFTGLSFADLVDSE